MTASTVLFIVAIAAALWGVVDAILIAVALDRRNMPVNVVLFRLFFFRYLDQYRRVTKKETGKAGPLFYSFIIAMCVAAVCVLVGVSLLVGS